MAWLPDMLVMAWMYRNGPTLLPPERRVPRKGKTASSSWFWKNIPSSWIIMMSFSNPKAEE
jgi:hypothetical protein